MYRASMTTEIVNADCGRDHILQEQQDDGDVCFVGTREKKTATRSARDQPANDNQAPDLVAEDEDEPKEMPSLELQGLHHHHHCHPTSKDDDNADENRRQEEANQELEAMLVHWLQELSPTERCHAPDWLSDDLLDEESDDEDDGSKTGHDKDAREAAKKPQPAGTKEASLKQVDASTPTSEEHHADKENIAECNAIL